MNAVESFTDEYRFLSNFYPYGISIAMRRLDLDEVYFPTLEHAFQACKARNKRDALKIRDSITPSEAKKLGRKIKLRRDWEDMKDAVMISLLRIKFAPNTHMGKLLITTKTRELIEGNNWGDRYWGRVNGKGENRLGELLMEVRHELREGS